MLRIVILTLALLGSSLVNPTFAQEFSTHTGGHCFTLDIPDYLSKTFQLNDVASLQYRNVSKEAYVIVIEDSKDHLAEVGIKFTSAEDFLQNFIEDYQATSENRKVSKVKNFKSNNYEHSQVEMSWDENENSLYMLITSVETPGHFYKIMCWTILEYKNDFKQDYIKISKSLLE